MKIPRNILTPNQQNNPNSIQPDNDDAFTPLGLCDCQPAMGPPHNLSCEKEGWFISSFQHFGHWSIGGGTVPLSPAICCRPCMPTDKHHDEDQPVAIISVGCHTSTSHPALHCEQQGSSFVTGFTEAVRVFASADDSFYPVNEVQCCTAGILLESGQAWQLDRCDCHTVGIDKNKNKNKNSERRGGGGGGSFAAADDDEDVISCPEGELLSGFNFYRYTAVGHAVPIGPAQCCKPCLSPQPKAIDDCSALHDCGGHGVCALGRCECFEGWAGADCSLAAGPNAKNRLVPSWAVVLIVLGSCLLALLLISVLAQLADAVERSGGIAAFLGFGEGRRRRGGGAGGDDDDDEDGRRALLIRLEDDDSGSVGSQDTEQGEQDIHEVEERIAQMVDRLDGDVQGAVEGGEEVVVETEGQDTTEVPAEVTTAAVRTNNEGIEVVVEEEEEAHANTTTNDDDEIQKPAARGDWIDEQGLGPLAAVCCSVCMIRPVQTVVVPCGHVAMCRRCSRRLQRCPICRVEIARRQRLFV